jgi:hypothetical protein
MVQGKTVSLAVLLLYLSILIIIPFYAYYYWNLVDWIPLLSLLVLGGILLFEGLNQILKIMNQPKLKIGNFKIVVCNEGKEGEYKNLYLIIKNVGGEESDYSIKVLVEGGKQELHSLSQPDITIVPDQELNILLSTAVKTSGIVPIGSNELDFGKTYTLGIRFYGNNFKDTKIHRLKLDLSSWENINIKI